MHTNAGNNINGGISDEVVWQRWCRDLSVMPSRHYDAPSGKIGSRFVRALNTDLRRVRDRWWNLERFIAFQTVILQRARHVTASNAIRRRIEKRLGAWDAGRHSMFVEETLRTFAHYLTATRR